MAGAFDDLVPPQTSGFSDFDDLIPKKTAARGFGGVLKDLGLGVGGAVLSAVGSVPVAAGRLVQETGREVFGLSQSEADALAKGDAAKSAEYLEKSNRFSPTEYIGSAIEGLGQKIDSKGKALKELRSLEARMAARQSMPEGDITKPSTWTGGADPSVEGYLQNTADVFGSVAPMVATAIGTRGKSLATQAKVGAAMGGAQTGGAAISEAGDVIGQMTDAELMRDSPVFANMVQSGLAPKDARARITRQAENLAGVQSGVAGAIGGAATGAILGKLPIGKMRITAVPGTAAVSGVEEGLQEVAEGIGTRDAINVATGMKKSLTDGTFGEFAMGAIGGGAMGAGKGLSRDLTPVRSQAINAATVIDGEMPAAPMLALPAPRVVVDSAGRAIREGQAVPIIDEPAARVQGRAEIQPTPVTPMLALPAPVVTVDGQGIAVRDGQAAPTIDKSSMDEPAARVIGRTEIPQNQAQSVTQNVQDAINSAPEIAPTQKTALQLAFAEAIARQLPVTQANTTQSATESIANQQQKVERAAPATEQESSAPTAMQAELQRFAAPRQEAAARTESAAQQAAPNQITQELAALKQNTRINPLSSASSTEVQQAALNPQLAQPANQAQPTPVLSVGITPNDTQPVTVRDGTVYIGKDQAVGFDSGNPVQVDAQATPAQIIQALRAEGVLTRRQKVFNLPKEPPKQKSATNLRQAANAKNPFIAFLGGNGVNLAAAKDFAPGVIERRKAMVSGYGPVFRRTGLQLDELAQMAVQDGYMMEPDVAQLSKLISAALGGNRIFPQFAEGATDAEGQRRIAKEQSFDDNTDTTQDQPDYDDAGMADHKYDADIISMAEAPGLQTESNISEAEAMRLLGFTQQEIENATTQKPAAQAANNQDGKAPSQDATRPAAENIQERTGEPGTGADRATGVRLSSRTDGAATSANSLTSYNAAEVLQREQRAADQARAQERQKIEQEQRADADAQRDDFTLTGSDRKADANPNQGVMFSNRNNGQTQVKGDTLESNDQSDPDTNVLREALADIVSSPNDIRTVKPSEGSAFAQLAEGVNRVFTKRLSYYSSDVEGVPRGGARIPGKDEVIYVNIESGMPKQIVGHELLHDLNARHPDLYKALVAALRVRTKDTKANREFYEEAYGQRISDGLVEEENLADVSGYAFDSKEFWPTFTESLSQPQKKTFFRWIAEWLSSVIGKAKIDIQGEAGLREAAIAMREPVARAYAEAVRRDRAVSSAKADVELTLANRATPEPALQSERTAAPLEILSKTDDLFALPKSDKDTIEGITADHASEIKVRKVNIPGNEVMYSLTMPDGTIARITERQSTTDSPYGADIDGDNNYTWIKERPGDNAESLPDGLKDVWIDVSMLKPGQNGGVVYSIAATYAHNTGKIFIGDPASLSDTAMRRRPEQMLASALKFGTTDHLAPHPRQIDGDAKLGIPPLKWVYGDSVGNIRRLVELNLAALDKALPNAKDFKYDLDTGLFFNEGDGPGAVRGDLTAIYASEVFRRESQGTNTSGSDSARQPPDAGWRTFTRGAVLRAILQRGRTGSDAAGRSASGSSILEGLVSQRDKLASPAKAQRIFYSNRTAKPEQSSGQSTTGRVIGKTVLAASAAVSPVTKTLQAVNNATDRIGQELARLTGIEALGKKAVDAVENAVASKSSWNWVNRTKQGLVADYGLSEEYLDQKLAKSQRENKLMREAQGTLERLSGMTPDQLAVAYQWLQEKPDTAQEKALIAKLPADQQAVVQQMKNDIDRLSRDALAQGLISQETYDRNKFAYIHRSYVKHEAEQSTLQAASRQRAQKLKGNQFKGRGMELDVSLDRFRGELPEDLKGMKVEMLENRNADGRLLRREYQAEGKPTPEGYTSAGTWEIRDATRKGDVKIWRDFTKPERERMGEIEDARYAFAKTMLQGVRDVETARFLGWVNTTYAKDTDAGLDVVEIKSMTPQTFTDTEWVKVPETKIRGTQVNRYGDLAGKHLPGIMWSDIQGALELKNGWWDKALTTWKISKTGLSPAVHVNNVMSNFVMADLADVGVNDIRLALNTIIKAKAGDAQAKALMERYEDSGAESGSFAANEIRTQGLEPLLKQIQESEPEDVQKASLAHVIALVAHGEFSQAAVASTKTLPGRAVAGTIEGMIAAYQAEDSVFRIAKFINETNAGKTDQQAGKAAREAFLDYNINAPWIRAARRTALPFISFTYRAVPLIAKTLAKKPWKLAKYTALGYGLSALAYTMLGDAGDEEKEKRLLPEEMQGTFIGLPKMVRLPWNQDDKHPMWLDVRRWLPAGDVTETNQSKATVPLPSWLSIGGPLSLMVDFYSNTNFKGDKVVKGTDTAGETIEKASDMLLKFILPNLPAPGLGSLLRSVGAPVNSGSLDPYAWSSIEKALNDSKSKTGKESDVTLAVINALGVKAQSRSMSDEIVSFVGKQKAREREIKTEITRLAQAGARNDIPKAESERRIKAEIDKLIGLGKKTGEKLSPAKTEER